MALKVRKHKEIFDRKQFIAQCNEIFMEYKDRNNPKVRSELLQLFKEAYQNGFDAIRQRYEAGESGLTGVIAQTYLVDEILICLHQLTTEEIYIPSVGTKGEKISVVALGGYGRADMAPHSDVDLLFLLLNDWFR